MVNLVALIAGAIFALGLIISHMVNPAKVLNFLDVFGAWDPSLAFVMATAIPVAAIGYFLTRRRGRPIVADQFHLPSQTALDARLMVGAALFGVGWGLVGFCPGPALVAIGFGSADALLFGAAMIAGMALFELIEAFPLRRSHITS